MTLALEWTPGLAPRSAPPAFVVKVTRAGGHVFWMPAIGAIPHLTPHRSEAFVYRPGEPCCAWDLNGKLDQQCEIVPVPSEEAGDEAGAARHMAVRHVHECGGARELRGRDVGDAAGEARLGVVRAVLSGDRMLEADPMTTPTPGEPRMTTTLKPLTQADLAALGFLAISFEREDRMGAAWARQMNPYLVDYGRVVLVARESLFFSLQYPNTHGMLVAQWSSTAHLVDFTTTLKDDDKLLVWYATEIPPAILEKCFNHDQVPAYMAAPREQWEQAARQAGVVGVRELEAQPETPEQSSGNRTPDEGRPLTDPLPDIVGQWPEPPAKHPAAVEVKVGDRVLHMLDVGGIWDLGEAVVAEVSPRGNVCLTTPAGRAWVSPSAVVEVLP